MSEPQEVEVPEDEKKLDRESAAAEKSLDKLTDKVEEKELDADKVQQAMSAIAAAQQADKAAQHLREKELAAVKISPEDVALIASELELPHKQAEVRLREHRGDVRTALESFL